jgi:hypothetical protein
MWSITFQGLDANFQMVSCQSQSYQKLQKWRDLEGGTLHNAELLNLRMAHTVTSPGLQILEIGLLRRKKRFSESFPVT